MLRGTARPRDTSVRLADVSLLEPGTIAIRNRIWTVFEDWRREQFSEHFNGVLLGCPEVLVQTFVAFGFYCFESGTPLHYLRQFLAHAQREFLGVRALMANSRAVAGGNGVCRDRMEVGPLGRCFGFLLLRSHSSGRSSWCSPTTCVNTG